MLTRDSRVSARTLLVLFLLAAFAWPPSILAQNGLVPSVNTAPMIQLPGFIGTRVTIADFNGDGKPDVGLGAADSAPGGVFGTLLGDGQGGFGRLKTYRLPPLGQNQAAVIFVDSAAVADFNEDGKQDLVAAVWWVEIGPCCDRAVVVLTGDGLGGFTGHRRLQAGLFASVGDFNKDGHADILSAGVLNLGDGKGAFSSKTVPSVDSRIGVGDLNGDGVLDLAQPATSPSHRIDVHLGDGVGGFGPALPFTVGDNLGGSQNAVIADFTGDGKADIVVPTGTTGTERPGVSVYPGDGSGYFLTFPKLSAGGDRPYALLPFRTNADAIADLLVVGNEKTLGTMTAQAGGAMNAGRLAGLGSGGAGSPVTAAATGDVNLDGALDVVASVWSTGGPQGLNGGALQVFLADGSGGFRAPLALLPTGLAFVYSTPVAGDLNGDGKADLVLGDDLGTSKVKGVRFMRGDGGGAFSNAGSLQWSTGGAPFWMSVADFDRDGKPDVIIQQIGSPFPELGGAVKVLKGDGAIGFTESYPNGSCGTCPTGLLTVADVTGDLYPDVLAFRVSTGFQVFVHPGGPAATLGGGTAYTVAPVVTPDRAKAIMTGDLNGDGRPDVVALRERGLSVLLNNGAGGLAAASSYVVGENAAHLALGDVNADGKVDVVVGHTNSNAQMLVYLNDGSGDLTATPPYVNIVTTDTPHSLALADMNADGRLDAVIQYNVHVRVALGDGTGKFPTSVWLPVHTTDQIRIGFGLADLNGDSKLDLMGGSYAGQWILLNTTALRLSVSDPQAIEGNSGTTAMEFTVSLDASPTAQVTVNYATANGNAVAGTDYAAFSGTLTFAPGETSKKVTVLVTGDTTTETEEIFAFNLSNASGAEIADRQGIGTILDDEGVPAVGSLTSGSIAATGATLSAAVSSDSGAAVTERGFVYSANTTNANPLIGGSGVTRLTVSGTTGPFSAEITGLTASQVYAFKAYATNARGTGYTSAATFTTLAAVGGATAPGAPTMGTATKGDGSVSVSFGPPSSNGGSAITGYIARCGSQSASGVGSPIVVTGLTNGVAVTCTVVAVNAVGYSAASPASNSVTPGFTGTAIPRLVNISTRGLVATGDNILIGGFIIGGTEAKKVVIRGRGPSMAALGVSGTLSDPAIRLFNGATPTHFNDDWGSAPNASEITASGQAPTDAKEAAILTTVSPNVPYTVHVTGVSDTTGIAIVEVFEVDKPEVPLLNISTRGPVLSGDQVMIGGFIIQGETSQQVLVTARGPSMGGAPFNVPGSLPDPTLELYQAGVTNPIDSNDDWVDSSNAAAINASGNAPTSPLESAIIRTLAPGAYTAIVRGKGTFQGIGLVEVYKK